MNGAVEMEYVKKMGYLHRPPISGYSMKLNKTYLLVLFLMSLTHFTLSFMSSNMTAHTWDVDMGTEIHQFSP